MRRRLFLFFFVCMIAGMLISPAGAATPEAEAQWKVASELYADGKCSMALAAAEKAIDLDPAFGKPWNVRGCALHCLGRNEEALESFNIALDLDPGLTIAEKNYDHVVADLLNGAPLSTPPVVIPAVQNSSVPHDGELGYASPGVPTGAWAFSKDGHAVFFGNGRRITVTGLHIAGCRYGKGDGNLRVGIWDKNLTALYSDTVPYDRVPFATVTEEAVCPGNSTWVEVDLPDHEVTGDFYLVLFTGSGLLTQKEPGIYIVYATPTDTKTSHTVSTGPNRLTAQKIGSAGYQPEELDWMIRVLYTVPPSTTGGEAQATGTPAQDPQNSSSGVVTAGEIPAGEPRQTAPLGMASIAGALAIAVSCIVFRK